MTYYDEAVTARHRQELLVAIFGEAGSYGASAGANPNVTYNGTQVW